MPNWVWCAMNRFRMFFIQISTLPTSMHQILTELGWSCMQINQFLTESRVQWESDFIVTAFVDICFCKTWEMQWKKVSIGLIFQANSVLDLIKCTWFLEMFPLMIDLYVCAGECRSRAVIEFCDDGPPVSFSNCLLLANCLIPHLYQVFIFDTQKHWVFFLMILYSKIMSFFVHCFEQYTFNETWTCYPRLWTPMTPHQGCSIEINQLHFIFFSC